MDKTYKKSDIDKYIGKLKNEFVVSEEEVNELVDTAGTMIDKNDNYRATPSLIKSKKTSDDYVRSATQGPEAYFIYGGPYYGINYSYVVNESGEEIIEEEQIGEMKNLVDEIFLSKRDKQKGIVKKANEQDIMGDVGISIPDVSELKKTYEKPMVIRKLNHLMDLITKEGITGDELAIILNHIVNNVDISQISDKQREVIGDKIKYGDEE